MTLDDERYRSINNTRKFLTDLLDTKRIPKQVKKDALSLLRHYPEQWWVDQRLEEPENPLGPVNLEGV